MNIALITAGGTGQRMHQDIPKQFLSVNDKPLIVYTMECFQKHPSIDKIVVVCLDGWHDVLKAYAKQFGITKLELVVSGGATGQESIYKGLLALKSISTPEDIILVHDGIRPNVSERIISNCIETTKKCGNAITVIPCNEAMLLSKDNNSSEKSISRDSLKRTQTPHGMRYKDLLLMHEKALSMGITSTVATCTMIIETGGTVYYCPGSEKNFKITTVDDLDIFKALLKVKNDPNIKR